MNTFLGDGPMVDTTGARTASVMIKFAAPEDVRESHPDDVFAVPKVACNFADRDYHYPTHTAAAAWVSAAMYHATDSDHPYVAERIKAACDFHRLWGEWERLEKAAKEERTRVVKFAGVIRWALPAAQKYPLDTAEQVKQAAAYFARYADEFSDADRKTFAAETAKAAYNLGWTGRAEDLHLLEAEGGLCRPSADPKRPFLARAKYAADGKIMDLAAALVKAADEAGKDPVEDAAILRRIDKRAGWNYGNPIHETTGETVSAVRKKIASAAKAVSGNWYNVADIGRVPAGFLSQALGAGPVMSEPVFRRLLSDPTKSAAMEQILENHGVKPVSVAPRERTDWAALASRSRG
jgi:hypothetical protein